MGKLIKALKVIQEYCDSMLCVECPFNRPEIEKPKDYCMLCANFPAFWDEPINKLKEGEKDGSKDDR